MAEEIKWRLAQHRNRKGDLEYYVQGLNAKGKAKYGSGPYKDIDVARRNMDSMAHRIMAKERKAR